MISYGGGQVAQEREEAEKMQMQHRIITAIDRVIHIKRFLTLIQAWQNWEGMRSVRLQRDLASSYFRMLLRWKHRKQLSVFLLFRHETWLQHRVKTFESAIAKAQASRAVYVSLQDWKQYASTRTSCRQIGGITKKKDSQMLNFYTLLSAQDRVILIKNAFVLSKNDY